jgi:hypothetical protein
MNSSLMNFFKLNSKYIYSQTIDEFLNNENQPYIMFYRSIISTLIDGSLIDFS